MKQKRNGLTSVELTVISVSAQFRFRCRSDDFNGQDNGSIAEHAIG